MLLLLARTFPSIVPASSAAVAADPPAAIADAARSAPCGVRVSACVNPAFARSCANGAVGLLRRREALACPRHLDNNALRNARDS